MINLAGWRKGKQLNDIKMLDLSKKLIHMAHPSKTFSQKQKEMISFLDEHLSELHSVFC